MTRNTGQWGGRDVDRARALMATTLPNKCHTCPTIVRAGSDWVVHHIIGRGEAVASGRPDLVWSPSNWAVQCRKCSNKSGQAGVMDKAKAEARHELNAKPRDPRAPVSEGGTPNERLRRSPRVMSDQAPKTTFDPETVEDVPWLADLLPIPEDAAWPLMCSPPPADAVGSYGGQAEKWIEANLGVTLRWWQRWALRLQWAHRADGSLCFRTIVESTPRRAGKSVRLRTAAVYRTAHPEVFGETQLVLLCGKDTAICLEHHRKTWPWARDQGWALRRRTGAEEVEAPDGSRFVVRGKDSVYGYDTTYGLVDEAFGMLPGVVDDGLEPSLLERVNPQLHLVSTSHRRATPLMRRRITAVLDGGFEDTSTLLLLWCAPAGAPIGEESTWRSASPHWTEERHTFVHSKYEQAMAGTLEVDPLDNDPLASFCSQYLNTGWWAESLSPTGDSVFTADEWTELDGYVPGTPSVAAVEGWFKDGAALSLAEKLGDDRVGVTTTMFPDVSSAVAAAKASGAGIVLVGKSVSGGLFGVEPVGSSTRETAVRLRRFADDGVLTHDSSPDLAEQVLALRVVPSADGVRMASTTRADAAKSACWAVERARTFGGIARIY